MGIRSKLLIACLVMSIISQMASTDNDRIAKRMASKHRGIVGTIFSGIKTVSNFVPLVTSLLGFGRGQTEQAMEEMKTMMEKENMSEREHGRAEMLQAVLEAKMKMDASSATACSCSCLMMSCATLLVVLNLPRHVL